MNPYLIFILAVILIGYALELVVETLNVRHLSPTLPDEFSDAYDAEKYAKSQEYLRVRTRFGLLKTTIHTVALVLFILFGGFDLLDRFARHFTGIEILQGLLFAAALGLLLMALDLPTSIYDTFVIEERFGFNKTTPKTFVLDLIKGVAIGAVIGGIVFAGLIWFFQVAGAIAWLIAWIAVSIFQLILLYLAPVLIMPLFNKFEPLPDGELRSAIEQYARDQDFQLGGIFTMDGSKRSSKANAYFTGFGRNRRIVLFDTLVEGQTVDELVAVLAHEMGHFKLKHILKQLIIAILSTGVMFYILSLFIGNAQLFAAFGIPADRTSIYGSIVFFGFLYSPISTLLSIAVYALSRRFEYQADAYAARTYGKPQALIDALKKLTVDNLGNLSPHPLKVAIEYSHPPVLDRIQALRAHDSHA